MGEKSHVSSTLQLETSRRGFLRVGATVLSASGVQLILPSRAGASPADDFGPLGDPDANDIRLPAGFTSRLVAESGLPPTGSGYVWHAAPDGGATFPVPGGGWVYVSNSELSSSLGGVGAIRFDAQGAIVDAYPILAGTSTNCAGGATPWNTWLSCEERGGGHVWECNPYAAGSGEVRQALGTFTHEAVAVDPVHGHLYETEDVFDGLFYRFVPDAYPSLESGILEAVRIGGETPIQPGETRGVTWLKVDLPNDPPTRTQVPEATPFKGGEGCFYRDGVVYFTTKGDERVWALDTSAQTIEIIYEYDPGNPEALRGVDNVFVTPAGDVLVAEDGGDLQVVALTSTGGVVPILQGPLKDTTSELAGPALSPDGTRLYVSSQRGRGPVLDQPDGTTYEIRGPFQGLPIPALGRGLPGAIALALAGAAALRFLRRR